MLATENLEQQKYERLWREHGQYRLVAPGEFLADEFLRLAKPQPHMTVIDFGCGTGRGAWRIRERSGATVVALDFADNCMDKDVQQRLGEGFRFERHDLTQPVEGEPADFGFCTDVMEHIPPEDVDVVLTNVVTAARRVYFNISTVEDALGKLIGEPLHLTVKPHAWWKERLEELHFKVLQEDDLGTSSIFWGTAYATFEDFEHRTTLNIERERLTANIKANLAAGVAQAAPHDAQDTEIMVLCGGPSLADFEDEIRTQSHAGMPVVTVNGAYNWAIEHGIKPGAQVIVDAREFNKRFTTPVLPNCKYLISSQCDPELVASLPKDQVILWHNAGDDVKAAIEGFAEEQRAQVEWFPIPGGTTVTLRALPLLGMLGFRKINVYGFDSCLRDGAHHAFEQSENDGFSVIPIVVNGKTFLCNGWMAVQAHEFQAVMKHILVPAGIELAVHGDGLIANILKAAAAAKPE